jgi:hypothetical protein
MKVDSCKYRILTQNGRIKYAGTNNPSWFTLENAKKVVDQSKGEMIYEYCLKTMEPLWEVLVNSTKIYITE